MTLKSQRRPFRTPYITGICIAVSVVLMGCSAESVPDEPQSVERYSDEEARQFTLQDLENPNIIGRLTPEQRRQIIKESRRKGRTTDG